MTGGALNAAVIARFSVPPLIVTLGTMALFRGVAEGITEGARNFSGFPASFLALGQGTSAAWCQLSCPSLSSPPSATPCSCIGA